MRGPTSEGTVGHLLQALLRSSGRRRKEVHSARSLHGDWQYHEPHLLQGDRTPGGVNLKTPKTREGRRSLLPWYDGSSVEGSQTLSHRSVATTVGGHKYDKPQGSMVGYPPFALETVEDI